MPPRQCEKNWNLEAIKDAIATIKHFEDRIVGRLNDNGEASDDLNNDYSFGDEYHHENHTDKSYDLLEAAHLLDQLTDYEETDSGLWQGLDDPERALEIKAAYTYGNAVMHHFQDLIRDLNEEYEKYSEGYPEETPMRRGPKEWSPTNKAKKKEPPFGIREFVQKFLAKERQERGL